MGPLVRALYGVGEIANSAKLVIFGLFTFFFYTSVAGLPGSLVGLASGIGLVWDAVVDPAIGHASDRTRLRLGRRHSFMLAGAVMMGLTFWAILSPPRDLPTEALFAWYLVWGLLARLASSIFVVPYHALGAELSQDYHERTLLTGVRGAFGLFGALALAGLSFVVFFPNVDPDRDPKLNYDAYPALSLTLGLVMASAALIATLATLASRRPLAARAMLRADAPRSASPASTLRNASFRMLLLSFTLVFLGGALTQVLAIHFYTYFVEMVDSRALSGVQVTYYAAALVSIPFWLRLSRIHEKRRLYLVAVVGTALLVLGAFLLVGNGRPFGTGDVRPILVGNALAGLMASLFWILPASMLADVADEDALATGQRREGVFFGIFSFGAQLATGLAALLAGVLIEAVAGLVPGQATQSALTAERIGMLFSLLPGGLFLAGALAILGYRLERRRVDAIQAELAG